MSKKKANWTVMVYLSGDNDPDTVGNADLREMKKVGSSLSVNIVAQFDRAGARKTTKRYFITRGGQLAADEVMDLGETKCGDPKALRDFLVWAATTYPAQHSIAIIWHHGNGWHDANIFQVTREMNMSVTRKDKPIVHRERSVGGAVPYAIVKAVSRRRMRRALFSTAIERSLTTRSVAFDDDARDFLDYAELAYVCGSVSAELGKKLDIVGLDACLTNSAEVHYQFKGSACFCVASEEIEPGEGWPYHKILSALEANPAMAPKEFARSIVDRYVSTCRSGDRVTLSACDTAQAPRTARAINKLASELRAGISLPCTALAVVRARAQAQAFEVPQYVDLVNFCSWLVAENASAAITAASAEVIDVLTNDGAIVKSAYKGESVRNSHGLSIYFPTTRMSPLYSGLDFAKKTGWKRFLRDYLEMIEEINIAGTWKESPGIDSVKNAEESGMSQWFRVR